MDHDAIAGLRARHPAWRILRAESAPLILGFLGRHFIDQNRGATPAGELAEALEDELYARNAEAEDGAAYPRPAALYLADWASADSGYLRRFYPLDSDEVHYDATPALEKAYSWVQGLATRSFVGTESRLQTAIELLRQIAQGTEADPEVRLSELHRRRAEIDAEIARIEADPSAGLLDMSAVRDRYQQFSSTARELLSDFREVEENFRGLDRSARERIATWDGGKGELLEDLVTGRSRIDASDQGRSFQAFYDLLLSSSSQEELSMLLDRLTSIAELGVDRRIRSVHYDWAEAAERTQQTVRQISEQLRRFIDDKVWVENRRVLEIIRGIEASAITLRDGTPPPFGLEMEEPGIDVALPTDRPLHSVRTAEEVDSLLPPAESEDVDTSLLTDQIVVDTARLEARLRNLIPERGTALLEDVVELYPVEHGAAELVGYLSLDGEDLTVTTDESAATEIHYDEAGRPRRARMPRVVVSRR